MTEADNGIYVNVAWSEMADCQESNSTMDILRSPPSYFAHDVHLVTLHLSFLLIIALGIFCSSDRNLDLVNG